MDRVSVQIQYRFRVLLCYALRTAGGDMGNTFSIPIDGRTVPEAFLKRVEVSHAVNVYLVKKEGSFRGITWQELYEKVAAVFRELAELGIKSGDKVCISSQSRPEWTMADLGIQALGAVTVPIYHSSTQDDIAFILENSEAKFIFVDDAAQEKKLKEALATLKKSIPILQFDKEFESFTKVGSTPELDREIIQSISKIQANDDCTIVYTSGTTGRPKGAVLSHSNIMSVMRGISNAVSFKSTDVTVTFLPFAHILGRLESLVPIVSGITLGFAESINAVSANMQEIKPTLLVSVPRIYEKIYSKILSEVETQPDFQKNIFYWALRVGREVARLRSQKAPVPLKLMAKHRIADRLVFRKIRAKLGGNLRMTVSGGAPLSPELCEVFHACGIMILEGYGLTETTGAVLCNRPESLQFGSVGKPIDGTELRIAADGEIQLRGLMTFKGYHRDPESTKAAFTEDGWFMTGDIGDISPEGFLRITDRKKELIVTSGGKNIAPQKIENLLKGSRFVSNGMVYGDKQKYLVALVTLNEPEVRSWAKGQGINGAASAEFVRETKIRELIEQEIKTINGQLASYESIKRFQILPEDFTVESGELTPSLKLKRKVLISKYQEALTGLYT